MVFWAAIGWLAAATSVAAQESLEKVVLQLKWMHQFQFAGYYAAQEKGYYRDVGLEVEIKPSRPGVDPVEEVVGGRADYGVGVSGLLLARHAGKPVAVLANVFQHSALVLLMRQESPTDSIHSLSGKKVMIAPGEEEILAYLAKEGLGPGSYERAEHSLNTQDLMGGKVAAMSAYVTDETYYYDRAGFRYMAFTPRSAGIDFYGDNLFTTEGRIRNHPGQAKAFRDASMKGWEYAMEHPDEIVELILSRYGDRLDREHLEHEAQQMKALIQADLVPIGYINPGRWQAIADTYADLGMIPRGKLPDGFLHDPSPRELPGWVAAGMLGAVLVAGAGFLVAAHVCRINRRLAKSEAAQRMLFEKAPVGIFTTTANGKVLSWNPALLEMLGAESMEQAREHYSNLEESFYAQPGVRAKILELLRERGHVEGHEFEARRIDGGKIWLSGNFRLSSGEPGGDFLLEGFFSDVTDRKRIEAERERLIVELRGAADEIKTLQGLLPICSKCKKVRDDRGFWHQVEQYIGDRTQARFSHGICPDCAKTMYPGLMD